MLAGGSSCKPSACRQLTIRPVNSFTFVALNSFQVVTAKLAQAFVVLLMLATVCRLLRLEARNFLQQFRIVDLVDEMTDAVNKELFAKWKVLY